MDHAGACRQLLAPLACRVDVRLALRQCRAMPCLPLHGYCLACTGTQLPWGTAVGGHTAARRRCCAHHSTGLLSHDTCIVLVYRAGWRLCCRSVETSDLAALCSSLGEPLSHSELEDAVGVLDPDDNGRISKVRSRPTPGTTTSAPRALPGSQVVEARAP